MSSLLEAVKALVLRCRELIIILDGRDPTPTSEIVVRESRQALVAVEAEVVAHEDEADELRARSIAAVHATEEAQGKCDHIVVICGGPMTRSEYDRAQYEWHEDGVLEQQRSAALECNSCLRCGKDLLHD